MAYKIAALSVLLGCLCGSTRAQLKLTRGDDSLKGPVRTVQIFQKDYPNTNQPDTKIPRETISYDRQGRRTETYPGLSENDSATAGKEIYVYDSAARLKEIVYYNDEIESSLTTAYDQQNRLVSLFGTGRMSILPWLSSGSDVEMRFTFTYSDSGQTLRSTVRKKETPKDFPNFMDSTTVYDRNGRVLEEKLFMAGSLATRQTYTYDARGYLIRMLEWVPEDHALHQYFYLNDDHGNAVEIKMYHQPRHVLERRTLLTYEYDAKGNWIKKTASGWSYAGTPYREGVSKLMPYNVTRRIITYYN
ncbi:MAG TPA: hypothetical protein VK557_11480 [Pyrinomonadaceae bacterium]|nr:hypothetical protein [Pyrinomonadaceae bacterium]